MKILTDIISGLPEGRVDEVLIGLHWTAVVVEKAGMLQCGLASTLYGGHHHRSHPDVPDAGQLEQVPAKTMAGWLMSESLSLRSLGMAAVNALLPLPAGDWRDINAELVLARRGAEKKVALVGHFPFVDRLRPKVGELYVLEQDPGPGDLPAEEAPNIIPQADIIAITGMTLINHTLQGLLDLRKPEAFVMVLGPSTPLDPSLFNYGIDMLSGAIVTVIPSVLKAASQGANFRQLHKAGVQLVTIEKEDRA